MSRLLGAGSEDAAEAAVGDFTMDLLAVASAVGGEEGSTAATTATAAVAADLAGGATPGLTDDLPPMDR